MTRSTSYGEIKPGQHKTLIPGVTLSDSHCSSRLLLLTFNEEITQAFLQAARTLPVQALEYKSMLRFQLGKLLDDLCGNQLRSLLSHTLQSREQGALLINAQGLIGVDRAEDMVRLATAIAHLIGRANFDSMSGQYYARFVVKNSDDSDSYLRQPHKPLELHNDGTYVDEPTDFVLMMKIDEQNMQGGESILLHLDDWAQLDSWFSHPLARRTMRWSAPPSKNTPHSVYHPVFGVDERGRPVMRYIDQFVQPKDFTEGNWLTALSDSLENSGGKIYVPVPVGSMLLINNHFWLHGRDKFLPHPALRRELLRQRGYFTPVL